MEAHTVYLHPTIVERANEHAEKAPDVAHYRSPEAGVHETRGEITAALENSG